MIRTPPSNRPRATCRCFFRSTSRIEARNPSLPPPPRRQGGRIRIGVLSPDFREHVNCYLLLPLFELVGRSDFEIRAYSLLPRDGSAIGDRIRAAADALVELPGT